METTTPITDGTTTLDGISSWSAGDKVAYNGTAWEKFEGAATSAEISRSSCPTVGILSGWASGAASSARSTSSRERMRSREK